MELQPVKSSMITEVGHCKESLALRVKFKNGRVFEYSGVTVEQYDALMSAKSFGAHFGKHVRQNHDAKPVEESQGEK